MEAIMADLKEKSKQALMMAADWYCNHQIRRQKPYYDANQGRFLYNYHIPSGTTVWGLQWTMARGIMVLLGAYEIEPKEKYFEAAAIAAEYLRSLQVFDNSDPRWYGAIREEVPQVWHVDVRDLFESISGLMFMYRITRNQDYLYRAKIAGSWALANASDRNDWPAFWFYLCEDRVDWQNKFYVGAGHCYYYLYKGTGYSLWLERGFIPLANGLLENYFDFKKGCVIVGSDDAHHGTSGREGESGVAVNDDGCGETLLIAYDLLKEDKWIDAAVSYGDYLIQQKPTSMKAGLALRIIYLYDLARVTGESKYREWADSNIEGLLSLQITDSEDPMLQGGYLWEDEDPKHYSGGKSEEYVVGRTTAYSSIACMRAHGKITGPYYGWERWDDVEITEIEEPRLAGYSG